VGKSQLLLQQFALGSVSRFMHQSCFSPTRPVSPTLRCVSTTANGLDTPARTAYQIVFPITRALAGGESILGGQNFAGAFAKNGCRIGISRSQKALHSYPSSPQGINGPRNSLGIGRFVYINSLKHHYERCIQEIASEPQQWNLLQAAPALTLRRRH
jgi:hypothetical protein